MKSKVPSSKPKAIEREPSDSRLSILDFGLYFLYSLFFTLTFLLLLPRFALDALRNGKYTAGFRERLGQLKSIEAGGRPIIWLHCVSVGETQAARPLAQAILKEFPTHALVVSTTTLTGQRLAREVFQDEAVAVFYFPFDWAWTVRRALRKINPAAVLLLETELWPRFLHECHMRRIPVALVNGRLSERSFRHYQWVHYFIARIVNNLDLAVMQSDADAERIHALGLAPERVRVSSNVKFDVQIETRLQDVTEELRQRFALNDARPLIVAASTHAPEERILIEAFNKLRAASSKSNAASDSAQARLLIAPRHPERFSEVASLLDSSGLVWTRRSSVPSECDVMCEAILLDTIGELRAVYPLATLVFVGGSIARTGGHNILEPAAAGACIITGAHTFNFTAIVRAFLEAGALIQLPTASEAEVPSLLASVLGNLLLDDRRRSTLARQARRVLEQNRGATARTVEFVAALLSSTSHAAGSDKLKKRTAATRSRHESRF